MNTVILIHAFLFSQSFIKTLLGFLKCLLLRTTKYTECESAHIPITLMQTHLRTVECVDSDLVPLWLLHLFGLSLGGEDQTGSECRYCTFTNGLFGVPHSIENVIKERLHLLEKECRCANSELSQNQHLKQKKKVPSVVSSLRRATRSHRLKYCSINLERF